MGGRAVPDHYTGGERTSGLLSDWSAVCASPSSPPGFPGMTFSLGNHFLRASTAIFNFNSFRKSCFARVNTPSDTFLRAKQRRRRAVHVVSSDKLQTEQSSTAAGCPQRLSKHRERTCILFCAPRLLSCFHAADGTVFSQINCLTEPYTCVWVVMCCVWD